LVIICYDKNYDVHVYVPLLPVLNMYHWHIIPANIRISWDYHQTFMLISHIMWATSYYKGI